jgi:hypothetical protein
MEILSGEELNRRLNTIAANAIREAQIAIGRGHLQWCDDDWRRMNMISQILNLANLADIDGGAEHYSLVSPFQARKNPGLDLLESKLADALANIPFERDEEITDAVTQTPVVPKRNGGNKTQ